MAASRRVGIVATAAIAIVASEGVQASELMLPTHASQDKRQYTLFNPTPDQLLRDLTTDRPDTTESPFTVDAGRVQAETNLFGYTRSRPDGDGAITDAYEFATTNLRIGLTHAAEFNVIFQPYGIIRTRHRASLADTHSSGVGGIDLRLKFNLWGNDTFERPGDSAFALLPFITVPTDRRNGISPDATEGGLIVPYAVKLSDKWSLGLNAGVHVVSDGGRHHTEYLASASLAYEWTEKLSTYYEVAARFHTRDPRGDIGLLATGFTYKLDKNLQVDGGVQFGITDAADRISPFFGVSARF